MWALNPQPTYADWSVAIILRYSDTRILLRSSAGRGEGRSVDRGVASWSWVPGRKAALGKSIPAAGSRSLPNVLGIPQPLGRSLLSRLFVIWERGFSWLPVCFVRAGNGGGCTCWSLGTNLVLTTVYMQQ